MGDENAHAALPKFDEVTECPCCRYSATEYYRDWDRLLTSGGLMILPERYETPEWRSVEHVMHPHTHFNWLLVDGCMQPRERKVTPGIKSCGVSVVGVASCGTSTGSG